MIKNDKQLAVTKKKLAEFKSGYDQVKSEMLINPIIKKAKIDALLSQIDTFQNDIFDYESLKKRDSINITVFSIKELPEGLIKTRIAKGWSQSLLASKIGVAEQQVQRDEANNYEKANLSRIAEIASILELDFKGYFQELIEPQFDFSPKVRELAEKAEEKIHQSKCLLLF